MSKVAEQVNNHPQYQISLYAIRDTERHFSVGRTLRW
jgi:hypothetical protein